MYVRKPSAAELTIWSFILVVLIAATNWTIPAPNLLAQDNIDLYLPLVNSGQGGANVETSTPTAEPTTNGTASETATPTSTATSEPGQQFNVAWAPPATATPTATPVRVYPDWVVGTFNVRQQRSDGWAEYRADGTFSERYATIGSATVGTEEGEWFVIEGDPVDQLVVELTDQDGNFDKRRFMIEQVDDDGFRITGGDARLNSFFYEKAQLVESIDGEYQSQWAVGTWDTTTLDGTYTFDFRVDGTYEITNKPSFFSDEVASVDQGRWNLFGDKLYLKRANDSLADATHTITSATDSFIELQGGRYDGFSILQKTFVPQESITDFVGQYYDSFDSQIVTIAKAGTDSFSATIWGDAQETAATGTINENGWLDLDTGVEFGGYSNLQPRYNGLIEDAFGIDRWLTKRWETALPEPDNLYGLWYVSFSSLGSTSELWLLPNGRYFSRSDERISEEGTFTATDAAITFDPICNSPYERPYTRGGNQIAFTGNLSTVTYHHIPFMTAELMASITARDEREAVISSDFANDIAPLALADPNFMSPAAGELSVDVNRDNRFVDAVTFAEQELYTWFQDTTYYLESTGGNLVPVTGVTCALGGCSGLDLTQGWKDKFHYWLFPNGRAQYYNESYLNATSLSPVTPTITRAWGKYKIENETIIFETDLGETVEFQFTIGRRRAVTGEICYENLEWSTGDDGR